MMRFLQDIYQRHASRRMFGRWSPTYEQDVAANAYSAADKVAEVVLVHLAAACKKAEPAIADIGIGTGLLAQQIFDATPCRLAGLDFADDMMAQCQQRDITDLLIKCDAGKNHWPLPDGEYDAV